MLCQTRRSCASRASRHPRLPWQMHGVQSFAGTRSCISVRQRNAHDFNGMLPSLRGALLRRMLPSTIGGASNSGMCLCLGSGGCERHVRPPTYVGAVSMLTRARKPSTLVLESSLVWRVSRLSTAEGCPGATETWACQREGWVEGRGLGAFGQGFGDFAAESLC